MKIIVVDDNADICQLLESILLSEGHDICVCVNPLEAEKTITEKMPDLVITDMLMSGVDGRTLAKNIRQNPITKDIKIILMSAHPDASKMSDNTLIDDFLSKPFEIEDLVNKVENFAP